MLADIQVDAVVLAIPTAGRADLAVAATAWNSRQPRGRVVT